MFHTSEQKLNHCEDGQSLDSVDFQISSSQKEGRKVKGEVKTKESTSC